MKGRKATKNIDYHIIIIILIILIISLLAYYYIKNYKEHYYQSNLFVKCTEKQGLINGVCSSCPSEQGILKDGTCGQCPPDAYIDNTTGKCACKGGPGTFLTGWNYCSCAADSRFGKTKVNGLTAREDNGDIKCTWCEGGVNNNMLTDTSRGGIVNIAALPDTGYCN